MTQTRIEKDSMGELEVSIDALYAAQTQRAVNNFPVSGQVMPQAFIRALLLAKSAAAEANGELGFNTEKNVSGNLRGCRRPARARFYATFSSGCFSNRFWYQF